jgi:hypothetical protein
VSEVVVTDRDRDQIGVEGYGYEGHALVWIGRQGSRDREAVCLDASELREVAKALIYAAGRLETPPDAGDKE